MRVLAARDRRLAPSADCRPDWWGPNAAGIKRNRDSERPTSFSAPAPASLATAPPSTAGPESRGSAGGWCGQEGALGLSSPPPSTIVLEAKSSLCHFQPLSSHFSAPCMLVPARRSLQPNSLPKPAPPPLPPQPPAAERRQPKGHTLQMAACLVFTVCYTCVASQAACTSRKGKGRRSTARAPGRLEGPRGGGGGSGGKICDAAVLVWSRGQGKRARPVSAAAAGGSR